MTERVLNILRRQGKNISCIFAGKLIETLSEKQIQHILEQISEIGSIRKAIAIFDHQLKPEDYGTYIQLGISPVIVPSDEDVHMALEGTDVVLTQPTDILCLGVVDDTLLPMIASSRETKEILLIAPVKINIANSLIYADYSILIEDLDKLE
jgi:uncharacterized protein (TIGR00288 family)